MDPKRWKQVDDLLQSALARPESEREAFLRQVCSGDNGLEREVRSLLTSHREAGGFLESPAVEVAARAIALQDEELEKSSESLIGRTISHYRIVEKLGGGGMGVVYKAQDTELGRFVAVKFLSDELARDPQALERFRREARTASALNHPNICTIYEIGNSAGQSFIVMEFLDGQTLRDRLAAEVEGQKGLPLEKLLDIGIQVSEGLEAAHEKGIIHRDIKPANIFITSKGGVKILDFGLAKLLEGSEKEEIVAKGQDRAAQPASGGPNQVGLTLTRTGVAMGTAGYMSPEQVRGEKLDVRTDIFSLGLVLYEMATGRRAFVGETVVMVHDAILNNSPVPVRELNSSFRAKLVTTIDKALHKEREQRYQTAAELGGELRRANSDAGDGLTTAPRSAGRRRLALWLTASLLLLLVGLAVAPLILRRMGLLPKVERQITANPPETMSVRKIEGAELGEFGPTDTDGQRAVYWSENGTVNGDVYDLYFGDLAGHTRRLVFKGMNYLSRYIASRDLSMVVLYLRNDPAPVRVAVINTDGTGYRELLRDDTPRSLLGVSGIPFHCCRLSWDNRYLPVAINSPKSGGRLLVVSVADGKSRELRSLETGQFVQAVFSPDGRFVAYETAPQFDQVDSDRVFVVPAQGGTARLVYQSEPKPRGLFFTVLDRLALMDWTADGRYLAIADARYGRTALYLYPIKNGVAEGTPVLVRDGDFRGGQSRPDGAFIYSDKSIAGNEEIQLAPLDAEGRPGNWRRVDLGPRGNEGGSEPSFSPDGQNIAFIQEPGALVVHNLSTGQERELYRSDGLDCHYASHVPKVFCSDQKTSETDLLAIAVDSGEVEQLGSIHEGRLSQSSTLGWSLIQSSHDDRALYLIKLSKVTGTGPLFRWDLATRRETEVASQPPDFDGNDLLSPDDRWVVRVSDGNLSVRAMSGGGWRSLASFRSRSGLTVVAITPDGNWILYRSPCCGRSIGTDLAGKPGLFRVPIAGGQAQRVGDFAGGSLVISPDGRQVLSATLGSNLRDLWVLEHFIPSGK